MKLRVFILIPSYEKGMVLRYSAPDTNCGGHERQHGARSYIFHSFTSKVLFPRNWNRFKWLRGDILLLAVKYLHLP